MLVQRHAEIKNLMELFGDEYRLQFSIRFFVRQTDRGTDYQLSIIKAD